MNSMEIAALLRDGIEEPYKSELLESLDYLNAKQMEHDISKYSMEAVYIVEELDGSLADV